MPQCVLDYNAAKRGVYYSDQIGAYYSSLPNVRSSYKKAAFGIFSGIFLSKLSDFFQQAFSDTKVLNESIP